MRDWGRLEADDLEISAARANEDLAEKVKTQMARCLVHEGLLLRLDEDFANSGALMA